MSRGGSPRYVHQCIVSTLVPVHGSSPAPSPIMDSNSFKHNYLDEDTGMNGKATNISMNRSRIHGSQKLAGTTKTISKTTDDPARLTIALYNFAKAMLFGSVLLEDRISISARQAIGNTEQNIRIDKSHCCFDHQPFFTFNKHASSCC